MVLYLPLHLKISYKQIYMKTKTTVFSIDQVLSHFCSVQLCVTLWTVACQAPLSMEFSRQEYWSGLSCPFQGIFPTQGLNPDLLHLPALAVRYFTTSATWEDLYR